tara:strand:- start:4340 stop:5200 length:861 start_codon:yes stop_codon:yes gene_type:complete
MSLSLFGSQDERHLLGASRDRWGRFFSASLASHLVGVLLLMFLISLAPERVYEIVVPNREAYSLVWIPEEGPGGGGGGGGSESVEPPQLIEVEGEGESDISLSVQEEIDFSTDDTPPDLLEIQEINIPALTMASAPVNRAGLLDGLESAGTNSQGSGLGGGAGEGVGTGAGPGSGPGLGPGEGGGVGGGVYRPGAGIVNPTILREVKPQYTSEALRAKVTGTVYLEVVVLADGTVGNVTVTRSLDPVFGLDNEAIKAARQWLFSPATRFGEPVSILVSLALDFNLR